jgi:hypothetical protein
MREISSMSRAKADTVFIVWPLLTLPLRWKDWPH